MEARCKTCKYFKPDKNNAEDRHGCWSKHFVEQALWNADSEEVKNSGDNLIYWDYEGYSAGFNVQENFGCVHHEVKND